MDSTYRTCKACQRVTQECEILTYGRCEDCWVGLAHLRVNSQFSVIRRFGITRRFKESRQRELCSASY